MPCYLRTFCELESVTFFFFYNHKQLQLLNPKDFSSLFSPFGPEYLSIWVFIIFQAFKMQMCRSVNCGHQGCVRRTAFKCKWLLLLWTGIYLETKWGWTLKNGRSEWVGGGQIHCSILHPSSPAWWGGAGRGKRGCVNPRLLALGSCSVKEWVAASHRYTEHQKHLMLQTSWAGKKWNCLRSLCLLSSFVPRWTTLLWRCCPLMAGLGGIIYTSSSCVAEEMHAGSCFG